jgi:hypothetical protein
MTSLAIVVVAAAVLGWVVAFPVVRRGVADVGRIPGAVWRVSGYTNKKSWRVRMIGGYVFGGWPGGLVVLVWRRSQERTDLRDEWHLLIEERRARHEIVLAHYEDQPDDVETSS